MKKSAITKVAVTAVRFTKNLETIPRRIEFDGISYDLLDNYEKVAAMNEEGSGAIVDVSDGTRRFRLQEQLESATWQLLSING